MAYGAAAQAAPVVALERLPFSEPERLLLAGDVHGHTAQVDYLVRVAKRQGCQLVVQIGDFGPWTHQHEGQVFLKKVTRLLERAGLHLVFIDGNHDPHPLLWDESLYPDVEGLRQMSERVFYVPRGTRWSWHGVSFLALGGGVSVDKASRLAYEKKHDKPQSTWWAEEKISDEDVDAALQGGHADVLLAHDCPEGVDLRGLCDIDYKRDLDTVENRRKLERVVLETRPQLVVHGHYHERHQRPFWNARGITVDVEGLGIETHYLLTVERKGKREHVGYERDALVAGAAAELLSRDPKIDGVQVLSQIRFQDVYGKHELKETLKRGPIGQSLRDHARRELNAGRVDPLRHCRPEDWLVLDLDEFRSRHAGRSAG
jgi:calcineurin-like phosphoesterase family protein